MTSLLLAASQHGGGGGEWCVVQRTGAGRVQRNNMPVYVTVAPVLLTKLWRHVLSATKQRHRRGSPGPPHFSSLSLGSSHRATLPPKPLAFFLSTKHFEMCQESHAGLSEVREGRVERLETVFFLFYPMSRNLLTSFCFLSHLAPFRSKKQ